MLLPLCSRVQGENSVVTDDTVTGRAGEWTTVEDSKLKDAVQTQDGKNWRAIAALLRGRLEKQCHDRYYDVLKFSIDQVTERTGKWTAVEDSKLKDTAQTRVGKNRSAIAALIPGRTTR
jgi:myb proto-oncogene protein